MALLFYCPTFDFCNKLYISEVEKFVISFFNKAESFLRGFAFLTL